MGDINPTSKGRSHKVNNFLIVASSIIVLTKLYSFSRLSELGVDDDILFSQHWGVALFTGVLILLPSIVYRIFLTKHNFLTKIKEHLLSRKNVVYILTILILVCVIMILAINQESPTSEFIP
jgi:membrane protein insertase Oxa1/YidC/SpoIIIJ